MSDQLEDQVYWFLKKERGWVNGYKLREYANTIGIGNDLWKVLKNLADRGKINETPERGHGGGKLYRAK